MNPFTPREKIAIAVALRRLSGTPYVPGVGDALTKLHASMTRSDVHKAETLAAQVHVIGEAEVESVRDLPHAIGEAVVAGRVLRLEYVDRHGTTSRRPVEPIGIIGHRGQGYLMAWCRTKDGIRAFRLDRIRAAELTTEPVTHHHLFA